MGSNLMKNYHFNLELKVNVQVIYTILIHESILLWKSWF